MKRRHITTAIATTAIATTSLAACSRSRPPIVEPSPTAIRWRMATSWPKSLANAFNGAEIICQRVSEMTDGQFVITPYPAGELAPGLEVMNAVQAETVECGHTLSYYASKQNSALVFATTLPFGLTPYQQNTWFYQGGGLEATQALYQKLGVVGFPAGNTGVQMGGWFQRQVKTLADFKGLKMRIPGLGGEILSRLGVEVKLLAGGEIYKALESKQIDAAEWQGPSDDRDLGLDRLALFYYYPGWWEPSTTFTALVNLKAWEALPPLYQKIFQAAAMEANLKVLAQYDAVNSEALIQLQANGIKMLPFSKEILTAAHKAAFELYDELAAKNPDFKTLYEPWQKFRQQIYQWNQINELSFANYTSPTR
jgi:TRAP-type mannitol/chloroaromatic compound transport system substrate-binding protein